jgi:hypothetical protein
MFVSYLIALWSKRNTGKPLFWGGKTLILHGIGCPYKARSVYSGKIMGWIA